MEEPQETSTVKSSPKSQALVMWIIWFSFLQSLFVLTWFIGGGIPDGENAAEPMAWWLWLLTFGSIAAATVLRWIFIPKMERAEQYLTALVIGLSLCELPVFVSLFLMVEYPQNQIAVLMLAVLGIIQMAPSYATPGYNGKS